MRKLHFLVLLMLVGSASFAQKKSSPLANRSADHVMIQLNSDHWVGAPDSISNYQKGFSRGANVYIMYDKQFRNSPKISVGVGIGVSVSNMFFKRMEVDITSNNPTLPFIPQDTLAHFKKYKLSNTYLEIPLELRFMAKPLTPNKSMKFAIGIKGGTMLKAQTKGKELRNGSGNAINGFTEKQSSKSYFNSTRFAATARVGYGIFSIHGAYAFTNLFKDGVAPEVNTLHVGLTISGL